MTCLNHCRVTIWRGTLITRLWHRCLSPAELSWGSPSYRSKTWHSRGFGHPKPAPAIEASTRQPGNYNKSNFWNYSILDIEYELWMNVYLEIHGILVIDSVHLSLGGCWGEQRTDEELGKPENKISGILDKVRASFRSVVMIPASKQIWKKYKILSF